MNKARKKKPAANKTTGKNKSVNAKPAKNTVQTAKTKKEKIALLERMIAALQNRLKKLKRDSSPERNEFRYNIDERHMNFLFWADGNDYRSLGLTHEAETFGKKNMPLKENPKKGDTEKSFIRNGVIEGERHSYSRKTAKNYKRFQGDDLANVKSKIRKYKREKRLKKTKID